MDTARSVHRRQIFLAGVLLASVVALGACGGGSSKTSSSSSTSAAISKADFIQQANAACKTMNDKIQALPAPGNDLQALADQYTKAGAIVADTLDQLKALPTPAGDEATLRSLYAQVETLLQDYTPFIAALRAGNRTTATSLQAKVVADQKAANDASNAYGLTVCGS